MITLAPCISPAPISSTSEADLRSAPICHAHRRTSLCIHSSTSWCRTRSMRSCRFVGTRQLEVAMTYGAPPNAPPMILPNGHDVAGDELSAKVSNCLDLQRVCSSSDAAAVNEDAVEDVAALMSCGSVDGFCSSVAVRCGRSCARCSLRKSQGGRFGSRRLRRVCGDDVLCRGFFDFVVSVLTRLRTEEKLALPPVESRSVRAWCGEAVFGGAFSMLDGLMCGVLAVLGMNMCGVLRTQVAAVVLHDVIPVYGDLSAHFAGLATGDRLLEVM